MYITWLLFGSAYMINHYYILIHHSKELKSNVSQNRALLQSGTRWRNFPNFHLGCDWWDWLRRICYIFVWRLHLGFQDTKIRYCLPITIYIWLVDFSVIGGVVRKVTDMILYIQPSHRAFIQNVFRRPIEAASLWRGLSVHGPTSSCTDKHRPDFLSSLSSLIAICCVQAYCSWRRGSRRMSPICSHQMTKHWNHSWYSAAGYKPVQIYLSQHRSEP